MFALCGKESSLCGNHSFLYPGSVAKLRSPRFNRIPNLPDINLTDRDREIIRLVYRYRFLRSGHITRLISGSEQQTIRRLYRLFHHGYLTRPRAQLAYYGEPGSRKLVYGIGNRGAKLLKDEGVNVAHLRWNEKNQDIGRMFLDHELAVSEIMVEFELACRRSGNLRCVSHKELSLSDPPFRWCGRVERNVTLGLVPDAMFAFENSANTEARTHYFLEADRGTMPIIRKNFARTSFYRKLVAYEATWVRGIHKRRWGIPRFRVLTVTTSEERVASMASACSKLKRGHGLFLFIDEASLKSASTLAFVSAHTCKIWEYAPPAARLNNVLPMSWQQRSGKNIFGVFVRSVARERLRGDGRRERMPPKINAAKMEGVRSF